jgi:hypothetical protein
MKNMSETVKNTQGKKTETNWPLTILVMIAPLIVIVFLIFIPLFLPPVRRLPPNQDLSNLSQIGSAMLIYANEHNDQFPTPQKWCDLLLEHTDITKDKFRCKADKKGTCSYAMNPNAKPDSEPDTVLLFEVKGGGWNKYGGPELLSFDNHKGQGCNILYCDIRVKFEKDVSDLRWGNQKKMEIKGQ